MQCRFCRDDRPGEFFPIAVVDNGHFFTGNIFGNARGAAACTDHGKIITQRLHQFCFDAAAFDHRVDERVGGFEIGIDIGNETGIYDMFVLI